MKDNNGIIVLEFKDISVGDIFKIPSHLDHSMEDFKKLNFNKARSLFNGKVEHFTDLASVWVVE